MPQKQESVSLVLTVRQIQALSYLFYTLMMKKVSDTMVQCKPEELPDKFCSILVIMDTYAWVRSSMEEMLLTINQQGLTISKVDLDKTVYDMFVECSKDYKPWLALIPTLSLLDPTIITTKAYALVVEEIEGIKLALSNPGEPMFAPGTYAVPKPTMLQ
jgi:hypothetical protein